jgi:hypothetical protein
LYHTQMKLIYRRTINDFSDSVKVLKYSKDVLVRQDYSVEIVNKKLEYNWRLLRNFYLGDLYEEFFFPKLVGSLEVRHSEGKQLLIWKIKIQKILIRLSLFTLMGFVIYGFNMDLIPILFCFFVGLVVFGINYFSIRNNINDFTFLISMRIKDDEIT